MQAAAVTHNRFMGLLIMQHTEKTDVSWWTHGRDLTACLTPLAGLRSTAEFMQL